jgi:hypothetical protein
LSAKQAGDGIAGQADTARRPNRPNISGLPGRIAIFQNASDMPAWVSAWWTRS